MSTVVRPRRSSGCGTCVRRRVRCDKRKPTCLKCEKGAHDCLGYDRAPIFVNHHQPSGSSRLPLLTVPTATAAGPPASGRLSPTLSLRGFQPHIVIAFLRNEFLIGFEPDKPPRVGNFAPTISEALLDTSALSPAHLSGLALAEALFGQVHHVQDLVEHSAALYIRAMRSLRLEMAESTGVSTRAYNQVWSCLFLGLYETVCGAETTSWLSHARGLSALIQSLGPQAFRSPSANVIFEVNRSIMVFASLVEGKRTFLELPEWKTIPWELHYKIPGAKIEDLLCDVPGLIEDAMGNHMSAESHQSRIDQLSRQATALRWEWERQHPRCCWEVMPVSAAPFNEGRPSFDTVLHFDVVDRAVELLYFDMLHLLLCGISRADEDGAAYDECRTMTGPLTNATLMPGALPRFGTGEEIALEICRCIDYLTQGRSQNMQAFVLRFPLAVARDHLVSRPELQVWLTSVLLGDAFRIRHR